MDIIQTVPFKKQLKKFNKNQKVIVDNIIKKIIDNPLIGILKKGNLHQIRVHKFHMINQLVLIAYIVDQTEKQLTFVSCGTHENFYRDLKGIS